MAQLDQLNVCGVSFIVLTATIPVLAKGHTVCYIFVISCRSFLDLWHILKNDISQCDLF